MSSSSDQLQTPTQTPPQLPTKSYTYTPPPSSNIPFPSEVNGDHNSTDFVFNNSNYALHTNDTLMRSNQNLVMPNTPTDVFNTFKTLPYYPSYDYKPPIKDATPDALNVIQQFQTLQTNFPNTASVNPYVFSNITDTRHQERLNAYMGKTELDYDPYYSTTPNANVFYEPPRSVVLLNPPPGDHVPKLTNFPPPTPVGLVPPKGAGTLPDKVFSFAAGLIGAGSQAKPLFEEGFDKLKNASQVASNVVNRAADNVTLQRGAERVVDLYTSNKDTFFENPVKTTVNVLTQLADYGVNSFIDEVKGDADLLNLVADAFGVADLLPDAFRPIGLGTAVVAAGVLESGHAANWW